MFHEWTAFYSLVGSATGSLLGLMFVVATLTAGRDPTLVARGAPVFVTPIVFHFAVVLFISAVAEVPKLPHPLIVAILAVVATAGFIYAAITTRELFDPEWAEPIEVSDKWFYGILPAIVYVALGGTAVTTSVAPTVSVYVIAATVLVLLMIGVRNAWDLATTLTLRRP